MKRQEIIQKWKSIYKLRKLFSIRFRTFTDPDLECELVVEAIPPRLDINHKFKGNLGGFEKIIAHELFRLKFGNIGNRILDLFGQEAFNEYGRLLCKFIDYLVKQQEKD